MHRQTSNYKCVHTCRQKHTCKQKATHKVTVKRLQAPLGADYCHREGNASFLWVTRGAVLCAISGRQWVRVGATTLAVARQRRVKNELRVPCMHTTGLTLDCFLRGCLQCLEQPSVHVRLFQQKNSSWAEGVLLVVWVCRQDRHEQHMVGMMF